MDPIVSFSCKAPSVNMGRYVRVKETTARQEARVKTESSYKSRDLNGTLTKKAVRKTKFKTEENGENKINYQQLPSEVLLS